MNFHTALLRSAKGQLQQQYCSQMKYLRWQRRCKQSFELCIFKQVPRISTSALANSEITQIKARTHKTKNKRQIKLITELTGQAIKRLLHELMPQGLVSNRASWAFQTDTYSQNWQTPLTQNVRIMLPLRLAPHISP